MKYKLNPDILPALVYLTASLVTGWYVMACMMVAIMGVAVPLSVFVGLLGALLLFAAMWVVALHRRAAAGVAALGCCALWYFYADLAWLEIQAGRFPLPRDIRVYLPLLGLLAASSYAVREIPRRRVVRS